MSKETRDSMSMSGIIRVEKSQNYSVTNNSGARDKRLSLGARGILWYALTRPDDWELRVSDLVENAPEGEHAIKRMMRELKKFGYLKKERIRQTNGHFKWTTTIYEVSQGEDFSNESTKKPSGENHLMAPSGGFPSVEKPSVDNHPIYKVLSNEELNERITENKAEAEYENSNERKSNAAASDDSELNQVLTETICLVCKQPEENLRGRQIEGLRLSLEFVKALNQYPDLESKAMEIHRRFGGKAWTLPGPPQPSQIQTEWDRQGVKADRIREMEIPNATTRKPNAYLTPRQQAAQGRSNLRQQLLRNGVGTVP